MFKVKVLDYLPGEEAGIKSVTFLVEGDKAYGYLKSEKRRAPAGAHQSVRCRGTAPYVVCVFGCDAAVQQ
ncbi:MAG: PCRF domain-containing protein [Catenisphaera adipataccumulans]|uniref:PCRF domain-containing protein n=1 Tax=Catenisphaera adipataccumulans TaxID=700500 RepID=UPI003D8D6464